MKVMIYRVPVIAFIVTLGALGCSRSTSSPDASRVPVAPVTKTQDANGTVWHVTSKSCNSTPVSLAGSEKLQFDTSEFAHIYLTADDSNQSCSEADVYARVIQSSQTQDKIYTETATLAAQLKRTVCTDKSSNTVISDNTATYTDGAKTMIISLGAEYGTAEVNGSADCPNGTLNFHLKRK